MTKHLAAGGGGGLDDAAVVGGGGGHANAQALSFLYPYGATLNVARPAVPVLSTGSVSFPLNRPVCALYSHPGSCGKLAVVGSGAMFADQYIGRSCYTGLTSNSLMGLHIDTGTIGTGDVMHTTQLISFQTRRITIRSKM